MSDRLSALDVNAESDREAIREILRRRRRTHEPELLELARRVRRDSIDPELRLDALNLLGTAAVVSGEDEEGARLFRQALDQAWGRNLHAERVACVNLAMIATRQRRLVEGFVLARRACALTLADGDRLGACLAHAQLAKVLLQLGDQDGFQEAVAAAVELRPEMDETLKNWVPHLLAALQAEVAILRGDIAAADRFFVEATRDPEALSEVLLAAQARHLRRSGRPDEALALARRAISFGAGDEAHALRFRLEELLCLIDLGNRVEVLGRAEQCLAGLRDQGRRCGSPYWRMQVAGTVGRALADEPSAREEAREAFEIAAVAALERSWEARQFFQEFPQLERLEPEVLSVLSAHAERFRDEQRELLDALRDMLCRPDESEAASRAHPRFPAGGGQELFVAACAWCHRVRGPELAWLSMDQRPVPVGEMEITHAICPECRSSMMPASGRPSLPGSQVSTA